MEQIGNILPTIFKRHFRREDARLVEILGPLWSRVAGKEIAEHSRPVAFVAGTLTLGTSCPTWAAQLRYMTEEIRSEINRFLECPVVKKVQVRLGPNLEPREPREAMVEVPSFDADESDIVGGTDFKPKAGRVLARGRQSFAQSEGRRG